MANTKVPAELSSTPGIIDNSSATAITIDSAGAATFSGEISANGGIALGDGDYATFGDSEDLSIYHLGGNTYLTNTTGSLILRTDSFRVLNTANSEQILHGDANGAVTAYYDNAVKLATTSSGVHLGAGSVNATLSTESAGTSNLTLGVNAGNSIIAGGNYNVVVGDEAGTAITTGDYHTVVGYSAGLSVTTGAENTAVGFNSLRSTTTGSYNTSVGSGSLFSNTTGATNVAIGINALTANTTASNNTAVGSFALTSNTTGTDNVGLGAYALADNTTASLNTASGSNALRYNTTGNNNTAHGRLALYNNTTADNNTAVGKSALQANTTGAWNTALGTSAGIATTTGGYNTYIGSYAGENNTTGAYNACVGWAAGWQITTGSKNTIIGGYNGNQAGLDIRTANNYIVLSDGDGIPRMRMNGAGLYCPEVYNVTGAATANVYVDPAGNLYRATSSLKYKTDVQDAEHGLADVLKLRSVIYKSKKESERGITFGGFIAEEVHEAGLTEFVQYAEDGTPDALAYSNMVSLCIKAIQELSTQLDAALARIETLEGK